MKTIEDYQNEFSDMYKQDGLKKTYLEVIRLKEEILLAFIAKYNCHPDDITIHLQDCDFPPGSTMWTIEKKSDYRRIVDNHTDSCENLKESAYTGHQIILDYMLLNYSGEVSSSVTALEIIKELKYKIEKSKIIEPRKLKWGSNMMKSQLSSLPNCS